MSPLASPTCASATARAHGADYGTCRPPAPREARHYREGFDDGLAGHPLHLGEPTAYVEGWLASQECLALLEHGTIGTVRQEWYAWSGGA